MKKRRWLGLGLAAMAVAALGARAQGQLARRLRARDR